MRALARRASDDMARRYVRCRAVELGARESARSCHTFVTGRAAERAALTAVLNAGPRLERSRWVPHEGLPMELSRFVPRPERLRGGQAPVQLVRARPRQLRDDR